LNFGGYAYTTPILRGDRTERIPRRVEISHNITSRPNTGVETAVFTAKYKYVGR